MKRVVIVGAAGLIGSALVGELEGDFAVVAVDVRRPLQWPFASEFVEVSRDGTADTSVFDGAFAVINVAGSPLFRLWTPSVKRDMWASRVTTTRRLVAAMKQCAKPPQRLLQASAVGYYGDCGDEIVAEDHRAGSDYLARLCVAWEREAKKAVEFGCRVTVIRQAPVLAPRGGVAEVLKRLRRLPIVGIPSGLTWTSWIGLDDVRSIYRWLVTVDHPPEAINAALVQSISLRDAAKIVFPASAIVTVPRVLFRRMGTVAGMIATSARVKPTWLISHGYEWRHPTFESAWRAAVG